MAHDPGSILDHFATVMDLMPTFLEMGGTKHPCEQGEPAEFKGRTVQPMRGRSWVGLLTGKVDEVHDEGIPMGWELHGRAAMRIGDWKIVYMRKLPSRPKAKGLRSFRDAWSLSPPLFLLEPVVDISAPPQGTGQWQLFDLGKDVGETTDLALRQPDKMKQLLSAWDTYVAESQVIWTGVASGAGEAVDETADVRKWMEARTPKTRPML